MKNQNSLDEDRPSHIPPGQPFKDRVLNANHHEYSHERQAKLIRQDGMMCEAHPGLEFGHDPGCAGPGMPWMIEGKKAIVEAVEPERQQDVKRLQNAYQRRLYDECVSANWDPEQRNTFAEEITHLHEELSEAFREWRRHKNFEIRYGGNGKPEGIPIELADVLIGLFYNAELHGFDLFAAVEEKHRFNLTRNYVAEKRQLHAPNPITQDTASASELLTTSPERWLASLPNSESE